MKTGATASMTKNLELKDKHRLKKLEKGAQAASLGDSGEGGAYPLLRTHAVDRNRLHATETPSSGNGRTS